MRTKNRRPSIWEKARREICIFALLAVSVSASAEGNFEQGIAAFKAGKYEQALSFFEAAAIAGEKQDTLDYNIAVTQVKLGKYNLADKSFHNLAENPDWKDMATFQLGLLAEKQGNTAEARSWYQQVNQEADTEKLRTLAAGRLEALGPVRDRERLEKKTFFLGRVAVNYDSNPNSLYNDLIIDSAGGSDNYMEYFAWGKHTFAGDPKDGWQVSGSGYSRKFQDLDTLDLDIVTLALRRNFRWREWEAELGLSPVWSRLDGETLTDQARLLSRLKRDFGQSELILSYQPRYHSAGRNYEYLEGWQHVFQTRWEYPLQQTLLFKAHYRFDYNDRDDLQVDDRFSSNSPTRHDLRLGLDWRVWQNWEFSGGLSYRYSDFRGTNKFTDTDGVYKEQSRTDKRWRVWAGVEWRATQNLRVVARVRDTDNDSNWDRFTYDKEEASLGVTYLY